MTLTQPGISPCPAKTFPPIFGCSQGCAASSSSLATAAAWQFVLHCPTDSSARISQWCISWCLAKAGVQPALQCSRRIILPKTWP